MTNYIQMWLHGDEVTQRTQQISARIEHETIAKLENLMEQFGISKTEAIQGALDVGLDDLLRQAESIFVEKHTNDDARADYEEAKADYEMSKENDNA